MEVTHGGGAPLACPPETRVRGKPGIAIAAFALAALFGLAGCGGGGGDPPTVTTPRLAMGTSPPALLQVAPAPNVLAISLGRGPRGTAFNTPFVSVTVCVPGTATCQTIDQVLLDTGSSGLRIAASALHGGMDLPHLRTGEGAPVSECLQFASGAAWGSVRRADVQLAGQQAQAIPVQVYERAAPSSAPRPGACATSPDLAQALDANGILGVGLRRQDCGAGCEAANPPPVYFTCTGDACTPTPVAREQQVGNPVAALDAHNNGLAILLPRVPAGGSSAVTGAAVLGVGTQPNNQLGPARVFAPDAEGFLTARYKGASYRSFLDTGTNSLRFPDPELPLCGEFYCPAQPGALAATITSPDSASVDLDVSFDSPDTVSADAVGAVIAGGARSGRYVNWGVPFFFGRTVFVAIEGAETAAGPGPYWAF